MNSFLFSNPLVKAKGFELSWGRLLMLNNSVTFSGKPIEHEEFLNQIAEALGIIIDRRPKGSPRKRGSQIMEKIGVPVF